MAAPIDAGSIYADVRIRLDRLNGDIKSVQTSLDKITKASKKTATASKKGLGKFFSFIKTSGVGSFLALSAVIGGTVKFLKDSEKAASDAIEVYSKFDTVFESIQESANKTADDISTGFGVAGSTARELLAATGDILVGFGFTEEAALSLAKQTTELSADLASFTNFEGGTARASAALTKALIGESESVKALGIVIRQDTKEYKDRIKSIMETNNVTQIQAKALAALQIATEQSGKAIGDVSRTWNSAANVQKRLAEQTKGLEEAIGAGLLPTVTAIRNKLGEWAEAITEVINKNNELRDAEKNIKEGTATLDDFAIKYAKNRDLLEGQLKAMIAQNEASKEAKGLVQEVSRATIDGILEQIKGVDEQIAQIERLRIVDNNYKEAKAKGDKESEVIALREQAVIKAQIASKKELTKREFEALSPQAQRIQMINKEVDRLAVLRDDADSLGVDRQAIQDLINDLYRERAVLQEEEIETIIKISDAEKLRHAEAMIGIGREAEEIKKLEMDYESLASNGLGSLVSAFKDVGEGNKTLMEGLKDGAKDSISSILEMFAQLWLAQATAAAVALNIPQAIGYTAAATGAYVASGLVQSFETGGIVLPSSGGSLINVAENGSPELMLNSGASGQALLGDFANEIVAKMGGGNMTFNLMLPNGDIVAQAAAPAFNNGRVELRVN